MIIASQCHPTIRGKLCPPQDVRWSHLTSDPEPAINEELESSTSSGSEEAPAPAAIAKSPSVEGNLSTPFLSTHLPPPNFETNFDLIVASDDHNAERLAQIDVEKQPLLSAIVEIEHEERQLANRKREAQHRLKALEDEANPPAAPATAVSVDTRIQLDAEKLQVEEHKLRALRLEEEQEREREAREKMFRANLKRSVSHEAPAKEAKEGEEGPEAKKSAAVTEQARARVGTLEEREKRGLAGQPEWASRSQALTERARSTVERIEERRGEIGQDPARALRKEDDEPEFARLAEKRTNSARSRLDAAQKKEATESQPDWAKAAAEKTARAQAKQEARPASQREEQAPEWARLAEEKTGQARSKVTPVSQETQGQDEPEWKKISERRGEEAPEWARLAGEKTEHARSQDPRAARPVSAEEGPEWRKLAEAKTDKAAKSSEQPRPISVKEEEPEWKRLAETKTGQARSREDPREVRAAAEAAPEWARLSEERTAKAREKDPQAQRQATRDLSEGELELQRAAERKAQRAAAAVENVESERANRSHEGGYLILDGEVAAKVAPTNTNDDETAAAVPAEPVAPPSQAALCPICDRPVADGGVVKAGVVMHEECFQAIGPV